MLEIWKRAVDAKKLFITKRKVISFQAKSLFSDNQSVVLVSVANRSADIGYHYICDEFRIARYVWNAYLLLVNEQTLLPNIGKGTLWANTPRHFSSWTRTGFALDEVHFIAEFFISDAIKSVKLEPCLFVLMLLAAVGVMIDSFIKAVRSTRNGKIFRADIKIK